MLLFRKIKTFLFVLKLRWRYKKLFLLYRRSIRLCEETLMSKPINWDENDDFLKLSICVLAITLTRMRSIYTLCKSGLGKDAVILLRVMFEDITYFNYMHNDR